MRASLKRILRISDMYLRIKIFFGRLSVYQNLEFFFRLRGGNLSEFKTSLEKYLDLLEIDKDIINTKFFLFILWEKRKNFFIKRLYA